MGLEPAQQVMPVELGTAAAEQMVWRRLRPVPREMSVSVAARAPELETTFSNTGPKRMSDGVRERARETVSQAPLDKWAKLACAGLALVAVMIIVRRVRIR